MQTFVCDTCDTSYTRQKWTNHSSTTHKRLRHHFCSRRCYAKFRSKHLKPWNIGKRGVQVAWNKGLSKDDVPSLARRTGSESPNWRGGLSSIRDRLEEGTLKYQHLRTAIFQRDKFTCQSCRVRGGRLQVHHKHPFRTHPGRFFDPMNCVTLCQRCHQQTSTWGNPKRKRA